MFKCLNMKNTYLLSDVCKKSKIKAGKLQAWMDNGWIVPSVQVAAGSGTRNIFNRDDLYAIQMLKVMIGMGVPRKFAGAVTKEFQYSKLHKMITDGELDGHDKETTYIEVYVTPDGEIAQSFLILNEAALLKARKKIKPAIVYSINLQLIVDRVAREYSGK